MFAEATFSQTSSKAREQKDGCSFAGHLWSSQNSDLGYQIPVKCKLFFSLILVFCSAGAPSVLLQYEFIYILIHFS